MKKMIMLLWVLLIVSGCSGTMTNSHFSENSHSKTVYNCETVEECEAKLARAHEGEGQDSGSFWRNFFDTYSGNRTQTVRGYFRKDGTYVHSYKRSRRK